MVQLFYYENRGKTFKKLVDYERLPIRVCLYPHEELGSTLNSYWIVKIPWWRKTTARILEVYGGHYRYTTAKVKDMGGGTIVITGKFKQDEDKSKLKELLKFTSSPSRDEKLSSLHRCENLTPLPSNCVKQFAMRGPGGSQPAETFQLSLSTNVSNEDFQLGYSMTGRLEQGALNGEMMTTHTAVVRRKGY